MQELQECAGVQQLVGQKNLGAVGILSNTLGVSMGISLGRPAYDYFTTGKGLKIHLCSELRSSS